jgi:hypothetical protein
MVLAGVMLLGWEMTLRSLGHRPTVVDDDALWATQRNRVYGDCCSKAIVLLGDCRIQGDLVPQVLARKFPDHRVVQLAVEGTSPVATLQDLASDEKFNGVVLCATNARMLCEDMWDTQQPYIEYYHTDYGLNQRLNRSLSALMQQSLVAVHPQLRLDDIIVHLAKKREFLPPHYIETHADRSRMIDYSHVDVEAHRLWALGRTQSLCGMALPTATKWLEDLTKLEQSIDAIQARGGRVIFLQLPTTGDHLRYDEWIFPKARFWDALAAQTSALCIHFKDVPELSGFECPDSSHLDRRDAPRFTLELAKVLENQGLFNDSHSAVARKESPEGHPECRCRRGLRRLIAWARCPCCRNQVLCNDTMHTEPLRNL